MRFQPPDALGRTLIEVRVDDGPGLVYRIASTLAALGMSISYAKVATEKDQALDVFYAESVDGEPIAEARHPEIREALLEALNQALPARGEFNGTRGQR